MLMEMCIRVSGVRTRWLQEVSYTHGQANPTLLSQAILMSVMRKIGNSAYSATYADLA